MAASSAHAAYMDGDFHAMRTRAFTGLAALTGSEDNATGLSLALSSSLFIGMSFVITKKGLMLAGQAPGQTGLRASAGGFSYLRQPLWWLGFSSTILGAVLDFVAFGIAEVSLIAALGGGATQQGSGPPGGTRLFSVVC